MKKLLFVALAAVVVVLAQDKATFAGVSVATDGDINIRFHYTGIQDGVTSARYIISDGAFSEKSTENINLVVTKDGEGYFEVPLAAAQMGCDVTVIPVDENGVDACNENGDNVRTYSVRDYAEIVLQNADHSQYFAALKAIVNYGSYASDYFADRVANTVVENEGIYSRETNPITGMKKLLTSAEAPKPVIESAYENDFSDVELTLCLENTIQIRLYYTYTGTGSVSGTPVEGEANRYYKHVGNIDTTHYNENYSAYLSVKVNGSTAITVPDVSVMSLLKSLVGKAETRDVALAMYNYYYWTATKPAQTGCAHGAFHYEAIALGATSSKATCTFCGYQTSIAVPDSVNYFSAPGEYLNKWHCGDTSGYRGTAAGSIVSDSDGVYQHIGLHASAQLTFDSTTAEKGIAADEKIFGGAGNYVVLRMRTGATDGICLEFNSNISYATGVTGGNDYNMAHYKDAWGLNWHNLGGKAYLMDEWYTYVIDIAALGHDFYPSASQLAELGSTEIVEKIGAGLMFHGLSDDKGAYIDVQYFAIVDNWDEVAALLGDETKVTYTRWSGTDLDKTRYANGWCLDAEHTVAVREAGEKGVGATAGICYTTDKETYCTYCGKVTATEKNVPVAHSIKFTKSGNQYKYDCTVCTKTLETRTVEQSMDAINWYTAPGQIYGNWNSGSTQAGKLGTDDLGTYPIGEFRYDEEGGFVYNRVYLWTSASFEFTNGTGTPNRNTNTLVDTIYGTGRYMVFKARATGSRTSASLSGYHYKLNADGSVLSKDQNALDSSNRRGYSASDKDDKWDIYVVDITMMTSGMATYYETGKNEALLAAFGMFNDNGAYNNNYIDVGYHRQTCGRSSRDW